jgi:UDP-N-acetylmuramate--alanine ligase
MDCYRNMHDVKRAFLDFMDRVPFYGMIVACNDDPMLRRLFPKIRRRMVSYGTRKGSDFLIKPGKESGSAGRSRPAKTAPPSAREGTPEPPLIVNSFLIKFRDQDLGEFHLRVPGLHNVLNATAAIAVGVGLDIPVGRIREALENFRGVDRRFQVRGHAGGVTVIDDYGHHPTEIRATLAAARQCGYRKIHVIFQPHRYTRTRDLIDEFATAFGDADSLIVLDIYAASEQPIEGITGEALARRIAETEDRHTEYASSFEDAVASAAAKAEPGDMILTLGAGSVSQLGPILAERLQSVSAEV